MNCLLCVQLQPVAARPPRDVVDALRHVGLERAGIGRRGPAMNLGVVRVQWENVRENCFKKSLSEGTISADDSLRVR